ncbi:MAG: ATP-dependent DNA ligase, partial [Terriglobales bacterium]
MLRFAQTAESVAATNSKLAKIALVADYLRSLPIPDAAIAAIFLSGRPFAAHLETTLQVGGALLWRVIADLSGKSETQLLETYRRHGDSGSVAADALPDVQPTLSLSDIQHAFAEIAAASGPAPKTLLLRQLLARATPLEAKYIVKIISGDLRIGLKESLVEEAIARAFSAKLDQVKRANMLLGDLGETLALAAEGKLAQAHLRLFHPIDFMLASPVESAENALSYFENAAVEDKYDGIRAQAHIGGGDVRLFSRTRDEITGAFPELPIALAGLPHDAILDGEIVAWSCRAGAPARYAERSPAGST